MAGLDGARRQRSVRRDLEDMDVERQILIGADRASGRGVCAIGESAREETEKAADTAKKSTKR